MVSENSITLNFCTEDVLSNLNEMRDKCEVKKGSLTQDESNERYCQAIKRTAGIGAMPEVCLERARS